MTKFLFILALVISDMAFALTDFDLATFKQTSGAENSAFSPFSLAKALDLLRRGTKGATQKLLNEKLAKENIADPEVGDATVFVANGFWWDTSIHAKDSYLKAISGATTGQMPFLKDSPSAVKSINAWANEKTHGLIKDLYQPNDLAEAIAVLANSIYIKDRWNKFADLQDELHAFNGGAKISFLTHGQSSRRYLETDGMRLMEIEMTGVTYGIMMPKNNFEKWKSTLKASDFEKWRASATFHPVIATTPKMKVAVELPLKETLASLGLASLFSLNPDFSPITDTPMKISGVKQKVVFDVNNKGIEAAAVTTMAPEGAGFHRDPEKPIEFIADRPFLFYLAAKEQILFLGQYTKGSEYK